MASTIPEITPQALKAKLSEKKDLSKKEDLSEKKEDPSAPSPSPSSASSPPIILDVRTQLEYTLNHINGAIRTTLDDLKNGNLFFPSPFPFPLKHPLLLGSSCQP